MNDQERDNYERFEMLYCDTTSCRVNEFERGASGLCPGCGAFGEPIPERTRG